MPQARRERSDRLVVSPAGEPVRAAPLVGPRDIAARGASEHEARLLDIAEGTPVMYAERITYAANGVAVEYLEAVWRGDRYDFKVTLTRPG